MKNNNYVACVWSTIEFLEGRGIGPTPRRLGNRQCVWGLEILTCSHFQNFPLSRAPSPPQPRPTRAAHPLLAHLHCTPLRNNPQNYKKKGKKKKKLGGHNTDGKKSKTQLFIFGFFFFCFLFSIITARKKLMDPPTAQLHQALHCWRNWQMQVNESPLYLALIIQSAVLLYSSNLSESITIAATSSHLISK